MGPKSKTLEFVSRHGSGLFGHAVNNEVLGKPVRNVKVKFKEKKINFKKFRELLLK
jgi:hypothetical protein